MKFLKLSIALFLLTPHLVSAQEFGPPVSVSGNNVSLQSPDLAQSGVKLIAPFDDATSVIELSIAESVRDRLNGVGSRFYPISNPAAGTAPNGILAAGTIDSTIFWQRITSAGAVTGVILEAGTAHGQNVYLSLDKDAVGSVTFAAEATSNVCSGVSAVLAAGEGALFLWDATDTCWTELGT